MSFFLRLSELLFCFILLATLSIPSIIIAIFIKIESKGPVLHWSKRIGIEKLFDGVFDIVDSDFVPKPSKQPYEKVIENFKIEPQYCIFFEDIARNLKPAHELGMKTVWIENDEPWAAKYSDSEFINYKTKNLANFLKEINEFR